MAPERLLLNNKHRIERGFEAPLKPTSILSPFDESSPSKKTRKTFSDFPSSPPSPSPSSSSSSLPKFNPSKLDLKALDAAIASNSKQTKSGEKNHSETKTTSRKGSTTSRKSRPGSAKPSRSRPKTSNDTTSSSRRSTFNLADSQTVSTAASNKKYGSRVVSSGTANRDRQVKDAYLHTHSFIFGGH